MKIYTRWKLTNVKAKLKPRVPALVTRRPLTELNEEIHLAASSNDEPKKTSSVSCGIMCCPVVAFFDFHDGELLV